MNLREECQNSEFTTPVKSKFKIKLNGKKKQKRKIALTKTIIKHIHAGPRPSYISYEKEIKNGNSIVSFDLDSGVFYFFTVVLEPFEPLIVEYEIVECNPLKDQLFTLGVALTATGLGIAFS